MATGIATTKSIASKCGQNSQNCSTGRSTLVETADITTQVQLAMSMA